MCVKLHNNYTCLKLHLCIKYYYVFKITHFVSNYTLCVKLHTFCKTAHFVQYQSSLFHVSIGKFYTWLNIFTQPAVVMVVTNSGYVTGVGARDGYTKREGLNTPTKTKRIDKASGCRQFTAIAWMGFSLHTSDITIQTDDQVQPVCSKQQGILTFLPNIWLGGK